ncbi:hypothetical protein RvY_15466 [Ramazzottius varieornatus]|uniref:Uncharacterized protein n=1 Tax=Ramazzottius varieornatus TaxID=947166 RepID=A0A1D1VY98_RAMVA|nr:hypothetical protein RvY_15466 [Ramazzottius varieornatus]
MKKEEILEDAITNDRITLEDGKAVSVCLEVEPEDWQADWRFNPCNNNQEDGKVHDGRESPAGQTGRCFQDGPSEHVEQAFDRRGQGAQVGRAGHEPCSSRRALNNRPAGPGPGPGPGPVDPEQSFGNRRSPINAPYHTPEDVVSLLRHVQRLEATNQALQRQVCSPSPTYSVSRVPSPIPPYRNRNLASPTPVIYSVMSKKPPPSTHFNFPTFTATVDKLLRQRTAYVVFQDLVTDSYVPDNLERKQPGDPGMGHLVTGDLP